MAATSRRSSIFSGSIAARCRPCRRCRASSRPISAPIWRIARWMAASAQRIARGLSVLRGFVRFLERRKLASAPGLGRPACAETAGRACQSRSPSTMPARRSTPRGDLIAQRLAAEARHRDPDPALRLRLANFRGVRPDPRRSAASAKSWSSPARAASSAMCRCLPAVREAVADYLAACPYPLDKGRAAFRRRARRAAQPAPGAAADADACAACSVYPTPRHRMRCATVSRRISRWRRRSAGDPGAARPRQPVDDAALHQGRARATVGDLRRRSPKGAKLTHHRLRRTPDRGR